MRLWLLAAVCVLTGLGGFLWDKPAWAGVALFTLGSLLALGAALLEAVLARREHVAWELLRQATQRQEERLGSVEGKVEVLEKRNALERM